MDQMTDDPNKMHCMKKSYCSTLVLDLRRGVARWMEDDDDDA